MKKKYSYPKIQKTDLEVCKCNDFRGKYKVVYTSPVTNKQFTSYTNDSEVYDIYSEEHITKKDLNWLKSIAKSQRVQNLAYPLIY